MVADGIPGEMGLGLRNHHSRNLMYHAPTQDEILQGAEQIRNAFDSADPFFIGRNGTIEMQVLFFWLMRRRGNTQSPYPRDFVEVIERNAGVFPATNESIDAWAAAYLEALKQMTGGAAGWYEPLWGIENGILNNHAPNAFRTPLRSLEPYYVAAGHRWTEKLAGRRVAVVSSFADTMQAQIQRPNEIWTGQQAGLLDISGVTWSFIKTGYAPMMALGKAEWPGTHNTWQEAVDYVVSSVVASRSQIAVVGCGGLGMIIAGRLKAVGISTMVLGGAIQVLFGIKGRRWANHQIISRFWNDAWVWPSPVEIPGAAVFVEDACYWRL